MEFSLAQSLEGFTEIANTPYPHLKSDPSQDHVSPGLGQIVNLFDTIVPLRGHSLHSIDMKIEEQAAQTSDELKTDELKSQTGFGNASLDSNILNSFLHPIVTDTIIFPKAELDESKKLKKKSQSESDDSSAPKPKKAKLEHKFKVV